MKLFRYLYKRAPRVASLALLAMISNNAATMHASIDFFFLTDFWQTINAITFSLQKISEREIAKRTVLAIGISFSGLPNNKKNPK